MCNALRWRGAPITPPQNLHKFPTEIKGGRGPGDFVAGGGKERKHLSLSSSFSVLTREVPRYQIHDHGALPLRIEKV